MVNKDKASDQSRTGHGFVRSLFDSQHDSLPTEYFHLSQYNTIGKQMYFLQINIVVREHLMAFEHKSGTVLAIWPTYKQSN